MHAEFEQVCIPKGVPRPQYEYSRGWSSKSRQCHRHRGTSTNVNANTVSPIINIDNKPIINIQLPLAAAPLAAAPTPVAPSATPSPISALADQGQQPIVALPAVADQVPGVLSGKPGASTASTVVGNPFTLSGGVDRGVCAFMPSLRFSYNGKPADVIRLFDINVLRYLKQRPELGSNYNYWSPQGTASGEVWIDSLPAMAYVLEKDTNTPFDGKYEWQITLSRY
jgi:hypothetical protein